MIDDQMAHESATRACLGDLQCLRNEEFAPFLFRTQPDLISVQMGVSVHYVQQVTDIMLEPLAMEDNFSPTYYRLGVIE